MDDLRIFLELGVYNGYSMFIMLVAFIFTVASIIKGNTRGLGFMWFLFLAWILVTLCSGYDVNKENEIKETIPTLEKSIMRYQELHKDHALPPTLEILQSPAAITADESVDGKVYGPFVTSEVFKKMRLRKNWEGLFTVTTTNDITCHAHCQLYNPETRALKCDEYDIIIYLPPYENSTDPFKD